MHLQDCELSCNLVAPQGLFPPMQGPAASTLQPSGQAVQAMQIFMLPEYHPSTPNHTCACTSLSLNLPFALALCRSLPWPLQSEVAGLQPSNVVNAAAERCQLLGFCQGAAAGAGAAAGHCGDAV